MKAVSQKRLHTVYFQLYDVMEKANLWRQEKYQWFPGVGGREEWTGRAWKIFTAVMLSCMILWWWIQVIIYLSKPIEYTALRMNPKVNYGLWIIMCQCRLIVMYIPVWWEMLRWGRYSRTLYFLLSSAVNLTVLKKVSNFFKKNTKGQYEVLPFREYPMSFK